VIHIPTVEIPAGDFLMGSTQDRFANTPPAHQFVEAFLMAAFPTTELQYAHFATSPAMTDPNFPVVHVSWQDATNFCHWLGSDWRLPTEVEWEYVCRAGTTSVFPNGNTISTDEANYLYDEDGRKIGIGRRQPVDWGTPNPWGVHDLLGNVCEWCSDAPYPKMRSVRGGGWDALPRLIRSSAQDWAPETTRRDNLGFRVARTISK
jgi:formylglycine-generating enzyme required for sulfatase activity